jgi:hypothetical protein
MTILSSNFIFIHVPKCAGKAISRRLGGVTRGIPSHAPLSFFSSEITDSRFSFGFVRNPWDRAVSIYTYLSSKPLRRHDDKEYIDITKKLDFKQWLLRDDFYIKGDNLEEKDKPRPIQSRTQLYWVEGCDYIGKVETIDEDLAIIAAKINLKERWWLRKLFGTRLKRRNTSPRADYQSYYDEESREFIAEHFSSEIERFSYTFNTSSLEI